jgi:hypothetical protein
MKTADWGGILQPVAVFELKPIDFTMKRSFRRLAGSKI